MRHLQRAAQAAILLAAALWLPGHALAVDICGSVSASGTAPTQQQALSLANSQGLKVTNQLDAKYNGKVKYQPAQSSCTSAIQMGSSATYTCKITQKYCVTQSSQGTNPNPGNGMVDPNTPQCKKWKKKCNAGNNSACGKYENNCQND